MREGESEDPENDNASGSDNDDANKLTSAENLVQKSVAWRWNFFAKVWDWVFGSQHEAGPRPKMPWRCASSTSGGLLSFCLIFLLAPVAISGDWGINPYIDSLWKDPVLAIPPVYFAISSFIIGAASGQGDALRVFLQGLVGPWLLALLLFIVVVVFATGVALARAIWALAFQ